MHVTDKPVFGKGEHLEPRPVSTAVRRFVNDRAAPSARADPLPESQRLF